MTDRLRTLSRNPLARRLGLPQIPELRRYSPGQPLLDGPALVGVVGDGSYTAPLRALLTDVGVPEAGADGRVAAVVLDATAVRGVDDLASVREFLAPAVRRLAPTGRLLVLGPRPGGAGAEAAAVAQALDGLVRSAAKEVRAGATANLLVVAPGTPPAALDSSVRFLLSARSAFVSGQAVHVGPMVGDPVDPATMDAPSPLPLAGRVAVVTGAARGIGAAIADTLARDGCRVVAVDVPAAGDALAAVANRTAGTALQLDITAPDATARLLGHLRERHGRVDVVVHNAGITRDKLLANMDADRWDVVLAVNLTAQLAINAALLDGDLLSGTGRIVCIASTSGLAGNRGQTNYAASKAGVIGMVRALAPVAALHGVTVNAVAPGFIETDMTARMPVATREAGRRISSLRQGGLPVDVAEAVAWLGAAESGGVTGEVVRVCGQSLVGA
ncbi:MAG: 3-oxoacyl-ACP reductase [Pseudonocardia sp.]